MLPPLDFQCFYHSLHPCTILNNIKTITNSLWTLSEMKFHSFYNMISIYPSLKPVTIPHTFLQSNENNKTHESHYKTYLVNHEVGWNNSLTMIRLVSSWKVLLALPIIALSGCVQDVTGADCPTEGFFAVPGDCTRFYRCVRSSSGPFQVLFTFCNMVIFKDPTSIAFSTFLDSLYFHNNFAI